VPIDKKPAEQASRPEEIQEPTTYDVPPFSRYDANQRAVFWALRAETAQLQERRSAAALTSIAWSLISNNHTDTRDLESAS
jgi:hypothetical protein